MKLEFGYGKGVQIVDVPDKNLMDVLVANELEHERRGADAVDYALANPIGTPKLGALVKPGQKIAIITSDISRPLPSYDVLPSVLRELNAAGIPDEDITVVFALGSHRAQTEEECRKLAGDYAFDKVRCINSDPEDCILMGRDQCMINYVISAWSLTGPVHGSYRSLHDQPRDQCMINYVISA